MLTVHHLNNSRSQRILWLLEELGLDYEIVKYQRDATTMLAPPTLLAVHPLGKAPVLSDDGVVIAESGAIINYVIDRYGQGRLRPERNTTAAVAYDEWLQYAEGSAMLPIMLALYTMRLGDAAAPLAPRINGEINNHLGYIDGTLSVQPYLVGEDLSGADIQITFVLEAARSLGRLAAFPALEDYLARMRARSAYKRAVEKGGEYTVGA